MTEPRPTPDRHPRTRAAADVVLIALFLVGITLPGVTHLVTPDDPTAVRSENRDPAPPPGRPGTRDALRSFPRRFEAYLDDAFRFRTTLVRAYNRLMLFGLRTSPSDGFHVGEDGWLFCTVNEIVEQHRGLRPASDGELDSILDVIRRRAEWLESAGCRYVVIVAPDKASVYPDRLPDWLRAPPLGPIPLDRLVERARERGETALVDVRGRLREERRRDDGSLLYYPYGTHWNPLGAYHAYHALFERLAATDPRLAPVPLERFTVTPIRELADSWGRTTHLEEELLQPSFRLARRDAREVVPRSGAWKTALRRVWEQDDDALPTAIVLADSFGENLLPFVVPHFSRTFEVHGYELDPPLVAVFRPDVVIQVVVERAFRMSAFKMDDVEREFFRRLERRERGEAPERPAAWYAGTFENPVLGSVRVEARGGKVVATYRGAELPLERTAPDLFAVTGRARPMSVVFEREQVRGPRVLTAVTPDDLAVLAFTEAPTETAAGGPPGAYATEHGTWHVARTEAGLALFGPRGEYVGALRPTGDGAFSLERRTPIGTVRFGPRPDAPRWIDLDVDRSISARAHRVDAGAAPPVSGG